MNDNKEFFELNEQELDSVVGGFNNDMVSQLNLKVLTRPGTTETRLSMRYLQESSSATGASMNYHSGPANGAMLQRLLDRGVTNFQFQDNNGKWVSLTTAQVKTLIG